MYLGKKSEIDTTQKRTGRKAGKETKANGGACSLILWFVFLLIKKDHVPLSMKRSLNSATSKMISLKKTTPFPL